MILLSREYILNIFTNSKQISGFFDFSDSLFFLRYSAITVIKLRGIY